MRTFALFECKNLGFFEVYDVSARTREVELVRTFCGMEKGVNFLRFYADVFYGRLLPSINSMANMTFLLQTADRALHSHFGDSCRALFTSNAPSGFYKYKFPKGARDDDCVGAKLFIYNAFLPRDSESSATYQFDVKAIDESVLDHAWVARDELRSFMKPKYIAAIDKIVLKW